MIKLHLLLIPILVGIGAGAFLFYYVDGKQEFFNDSDGKDVLLTKNKLLQGGSPVLGNAFAPITILEWGDYQCTFCYRFHQNSLNVIYEEYIETGKVKLVFKDFPLNGPDSVLAAEATYCAEDQGMYWEYHDVLYNNWAGERTEWITRSSLTEFAQQLDLDLEKFNNCIDSHIYKDRVLGLEQYGKDIGIDATPTFLIFKDEKIIKIRGNQPLDAFRKAIDGL